MNDYEKMALKIWVITVLKWIGVATPFILLGWYTGDAFAVHHGGTTADIVGGVFLGILVTGISGVLSGLIYIGVRELWRKIVYKWQDTVEKVEREYADKFDRL